MRPRPIDHEVFFDRRKILVSKTDTKGIIKYANEEFINIVGYSEEELIGKAHNIVRHPDMPKVIFKMLWDFLQRGEEIHAYVKNLCKDGSFYWVFANVTPSFDHNHKIAGYHSARRVPDKTTLQNVIIPLYKELLALEQNGGIQRSEQKLQQILQEKGMAYDEFILSI